MSQHGPIWRVTTAQAGKSVPGAIEHRVVLAVIRTLAVAAPNDAIHRVAGEESGSSGFEEGDRIYQFQRNVHSEEQSDPS